MYNATVSNEHQERAAELARMREANEARIKQLEEIEARMVADLQHTLQMKNNAMNELASKSKGLKKVMQPRMAYKYAPRENSSSELINMQAQSQYAFSGRKSSNFVNDASAISLYNRRTKSITQNATPGVKAAGPSSGQDIMFHDNSATGLTNSSNVINPKSMANEVIVMAPSQKKQPAAQHDARQHVIIAENTLKEGASREGMDT